ncbi:MAG: hypothetical protein H8E38_00280 [SAR324 cluster bacterium]|nr:hypothetical protein [SAR324 cluster bacterium]MBL7006710.1 hypothetical protein [Spirochaetia bacterium]
MKNNTKVVKSYVSHEDVQSAMARFFEHGGKITKIESPCQEILLKHDMGEEELDIIDPHAGNLTSSGLGTVGNILRQEVQTEHEKA